MSGFWAARGKLRHDKVYFAKHDDRLVPAGKFHGAIMEPEWKSKKRRKPCANLYRTFKAFTGVELEVGEGPVFVETRRAGK